VPCGGLGASPWPVDLSENLRTSPRPIGVDLPDAERSVLRASTIGVDLPEDERSALRTYTSSPGKRPEGMDRVNPRLLAPDRGSLCDPLKSGSNRGRPK